METRETITLDARTQQRLLVLTHVIAGELDVGEAAAYLHLSVRQVHRLADRLRSNGAAGLVHGNRGRQPANRVDDEVRASIVDQALTTYAGFNPVHLAETLAEEDPSIPSTRTVQRILAEAHVHPPRTRRSPAHRSRRERMPRAGMLLQTDGSRHDWLEGRGPELTLVGGIDDATGTVTGGEFRAAEDAAGYFEMLAQTVRRHGLPLALYTDLSGVFIKDPNRPPTLAEQLTGRRSLTQVGRALDVLDIRWIGARSPQAKGRAERLWGTLQDRLVSELRRAGVSTLEGATSCSPGTCPGTTSGSRSRRPTRHRPGGPGRQTCRPRPCCASSTRGGPPRTRQSAGTAAPWPCLVGTAEAPGPGGGSSSRNASTAASGLVTSATCTRSSRHPRPPRSCVHGRSTGCPS